jgi:glyoxylase-like metal-dependent hydrolase (beta-lactamase superfamily II)
MNKNVARDPCYGGRTPRFPGFFQGLMRWGTGVCLVVVFQMMEQGYAESVVDLGSMSMNSRELASGLYILEGAVNTGVLVSGSQALLVDCCDSVTPSRLAALGVQKVEKILCTQHRRSHIAGIYPFLIQGAQVGVPETERPLFENVEEYWRNPKNRWHLYHFQPGPEVLPKPIQVAEALAEGGTVEWRGHTIHVLDTPGATDGSVSYALDVEGKHFVFCGDVISGPGQIWEIDCLQKGFGGVTDYHGFMGNREKLLMSLGKLKSSGAHVLVPSHGTPIDAPGPAIDLLEQRLDTLWRNYAAISAANHYFPNLLKDLSDDPQRMKPAETKLLPRWVRRVAYTSFAVISESSDMLLIDCGHDSVLQKLDEWKREDKVHSVDACWVTHYHDDHVDSLHRLWNAYSCPIWCDKSMGDVLENPGRYFLPCISPCRATVARMTQDGEKWNWREFQLTAFHLPGQTLYHGGLLVEGHGKKVFFAGDSGAPTGIDDYTAGNRTFLGAGRGFRRCVEIWRECHPDFIVNQHQGRAFVFTDEELDTIDHVLAERELILAEMVPWADPNFALDTWWVRTYPYEQQTAPGATIALDVQFTNHGKQPAKGQVEPVLPDGWTWDPARSRTESTAPPRTCGLVDSNRPDSDVAARIWLTVPEDTPPGRYVIPVRITWDGRYLGQIRHGVVEVF